MTRRLSNGLDTPVLELGFSTRVLNCFRNRDLGYEWDDRAKFFHRRTGSPIVTVGQLVDLDRNKLLAIRSFGRTCLREVEAVLDAHGLRLGSRMVVTGEVDRAAARADDHRLLLRWMFSRVVKVRGGPGALSRIYVDGQQIYVDLDDDGCPTLDTSLRDTSLRDHILSDLAEEANAEGSSTGGGR